LDESHLAPDPQQDIPFPLPDMWQQPTAAIARRTAAPAPKNFETNGRIFSPFFYFTAASALDHR